MKQLSYNGNLYQLRDLSAMTQLNLARRLTPLSILMQGLTDEANKDKDKTLLVLVLLGQLSDADNEYVMKSCLSSILLQQEEQWVPIVTASLVPMFTFIDMKAMVDLAAASIVENLGDFFHTALSAIPANQKKTPG